MLFNINWTNIYHREIRTSRQHNQQHSETHLWKWENLGEDILLSSTRDCYRRHPEIWYNGGTAVTSRDVKKYIYTYINACIYIYVYKRDLG